MSTLNEKHVTDLKGKYWEDHEIVHAVSFDPSTPFRALSAAQVYLEDLGYGIGSLCEEDPIAFLHEVEELDIWDNIPVYDRKKLDGVIVTETSFKSGEVLIMFFTPPKY